MSGASFDDMLELQKAVVKLPLWLRLKLLAAMGRFCSQCGRVGKVEARGAGITTLCCEGGKGLDAHERKEWHAEL